MQYFYAIARKDEDTAYGLTFSGLPGCFAEADDVTELVPAGVEALALWFDNTPWVEPQSLEEVRNAAARDLAQGAFLVAVPYG
jgi:predicted RNase H-like HicB family nuclease